jgi:hypothetical protein
MVTKFGVISLNGRLFEPHGVGLQRGALGIDHTYWPIEQSDAHSDRGFGCHSMSNVLRVRYSSISQLKLYREHSTFFQSLGK